MTCMTDIEKKKRILYRTSRKVLPGVSQTEEKQTVTHRVPYYRC